jgi:hypothetical protein
MLAPLAACLILLAASQSSPPEESAGLSLVVVVEGWSDFHYAGCPRLAGLIDIVVLSRARASSKGLKPHETCDPFRVPSSVPKEKPGAGSANAMRPLRPALPKTSSAPAPPHVVYVVPGDRRYHRGECSKIGLGARRVSIELLGRRHVPCPACKPPARPAPR